MRYLCGPNRRSERGECRIKPLTADMFYTCFPGASRELVGLFVLLLLDWWVCSAGPAAGMHQSHRADRKRVSSFRDGGDSLRAAGPFGRTQLWHLGLFGLFC